MLAYPTKVLGLTLPTLDTPKVTACERTACTVEWISSFVKQGQDQTRLGFNLSYSPAATTNASTSGGGGSRGGGYVEVRHMELICVIKLHGITWKSVGRKMFGGIQQDKN